MGGNAEQLEAERIYQWRKIQQWNMCKYILKKNTWFSLLQMRSNSWFLANAQKVDAVVRVVHTLSLFKVEGLPFNLKICSGQCPLCLSRGKLPSTVFLDAYL